MLNLEPFDTIKVRLQTQPEVYTSLTQAVTRTIKDEGLQGFYKGTVAPLVGISACVSIQFGTLAVVKSMMVFDNESRGKRGGEAGLSVGQLAVAGACAGVANSVLSGPLEHVRTRLQTSTQFNGMLHWLLNYGRVGVLESERVDDL
jgi:solute carrier family 25 carnitine/acylcarnitine transporter 20/29